MIPGTLIAAAAVAGTSICNQQVVFLGGGSVGCDTAEKIVALTMDDGFSREGTRRRIFMIDRLGLLTDETSDLLDLQHNLVTP